MEARCHMMSKIVRNESGHAAKNDRSVIKTTVALLQGGPWLPSREKK